MKKEENMSLRKGQTILIKGQEEALKVVDALKGCFTYSVNECTKVIKRGRAIHTVHTMPEYKFKISILGDCVLKRNSTVATGLVLKSIRVE